MTQAAVYRYPSKVIAHRGGGTLAPENTVAGLREAKSRGYAAVEFDAMLAGDGVPVLMHDDTLERTTSGHGDVPSLSSTALAALDAGAWRDARFAGEPVPSLAAAAACCRELGLYANVEIKPFAPGGAALALRTGETVAALCEARWAGARAAVLLSSFSMPALEAARRVAPALERACLFDAVPDDWAEWMARTGSVALHCNGRRLERGTAAAVKRAGHALMCWTVNEVADARRLFDWGVDAICTDRLDRFAALAAGEADW